MSDMEAGAELDAKLAVAMGWKPFDCHAHRVDESFVAWTDERGEVRALWKPSHFILDAVEAAEKMRKAGRISWWAITSAMDEAVHFDAEVGRVPYGKKLGASPDSPAHALTLALLAALSVDQKADGAKG